MKPSNLLRTFALPALIAAAATTARADDAELKAVYGHVSVRPASTRKWVRAKPGLKLTVSDQVMTGPGALVQLAFDSGARMLVKDKSRFSLRQSKAGPQVSFRTGEFLIGFRPTQQTARPQFFVRTPVSVAAVIGTVFWGKADEQNVTTWACFTGHIDVTAKGRKVVLQPGQTTSVKPNEAPAAAAPHSIPADYVKTFAVDGSLQGIDEQLAAE